MFIYVNSYPSVGYKFDPLKFLSPQNHPSPRNIFYTRFLIPIYTLAMTSEYLPALSMNTRYDAFQGVQVPPSGPVSSYPTMYPVYGLPRPPLTSLPTATHPSPPSFFPDSYGSTGPSFMPNYQGQGTVFPPATITPTAFQEPFYPSTGMFPRGVTANYLPSEYTGHFEQSAPPTFRWPLCIQPEVATTQWHAQNQVAQDFLVMQPPQEPRSVYRENYQTNATCHASSSSAPEVSLQGNQWENQPAFQLPAENTMPNNRHHGHESKYAVSLTV